MTSLPNLGGRSGNTAWRMWLLFHRIRWNNSSLVSSASSAAVKMSETKRHRPERTPRWMTAYTRCRSVCRNKAPPSVGCVRQFGDDKTSKNCIASCQAPGRLARAVGAQGSDSVKDCAQELMMCCKWSLTVYLISSHQEFSTCVIPGSSGEGVNYRFRLVLKTTSIDLLRSARLSVLPRPLGYE